MLYREVFTVCCGYHMKHMDTVCVCVCVCVCQNAEYDNVDVCAKASALNFRYIEYIIVITVFP